MSTVCSPYCTPSTFTLIRLPFHSISKIWKFLDQDSLDRLLDNISALLSFQDAINPPAVSMRLLMVSPLRVLSSSLPIEDAILISRCDLDSNVLSNVFSALCNVITTKKKFTIVQVKKIDDKKLETYQEIPNRHVAIWLLLRHVQREIQIFPLY